MKAKSSVSSLEDNGGFVTPSDSDEKSSKQVKRATVVGNPMFSKDSNPEMGPTESLGLDDLDMDYEQIMHYFDNLKVQLSPPSAKQFTRQPSSFQI